MLMRFALTAALSLAACTSGGGTSTGISEVSCPPESTLTYANFGQDLITSECMSCHSTKSPKLGTLDLVRSRTSQILEAAVYTDAMPEGAAMSLEQRQLLGEWLACGAP
jgi:uncharacterized membrane protein